MGEKAGMDWGESGSDGSLEEVGGKESIFRKYCVKKNLFSIKMLLCGLSRFSVNVTR